MSQDDGDRDPEQPTPADHGPDRLLEFHATLQRHRLSARTIRTVARIGEALRQRTAATGVEWSAMIDTATAARVGPILSGGEAYVDLDAQFAALDWRGQYLAIHTHPNSTSFSDVDGGTLASNPPLRTIVVVGRNGTWYVLSKLPGRPTPNALDVRLAYLQQLRTIVPKYRTLVQSGQIDAVEAWRQQTHEAWELVALDLRLRYDRVVVS
ncbi:MAG TPA: hypothetical protein VII06_31470 [Chloroflexota bacterium]|jgi:hypothetical protein